ncbi:MAG: hypothetical protein HKO98_09975 [Gemmatimonadetes bacterium]|nr:hypothetical protein [Gemmatimonadota bacterium]
MSETTDLAATRPDVLADLSVALEAWWAETGAFTAFELNPDYRPEVR